MNKKLNGNSEVNGPRTPSRKNKQRETNERQNEQERKIKKRKKSVKE